MSSDDGGYAHVIAHGVQSFWNEYLIKVNCYRRRNLALSKSNAWFSVMAFGPEHRMQHRLRALRWLVATLCNSLYLLFAPGVEAGRSIALITHPRQLKHLDPEQQAFRVGLHNFRFFQYPHLLSVLTLREMGTGFWRARRDYGEFMRSCRRECEKRGVDWAVFRRLCNLGYLRFAGYVLSYLALKHLGEVEVATTVQLEACSSFLSTYRAAGLALKLVGHQHGLFELPPHPYQYEPIGFDTYYLRYTESETWFLKTMLSNRDCVIRHRAQASTIDWQTVDREGFNKVLAYAAQDTLPNDIANMDALLSYAEATNALLLLYLHPNFPDFPVQRWAGSHNFRVSPQERHMNIDLLVTRYSSLAMDYRTGLGTRVLFAPGTDSLCIFEDPDVAVCRNIDDLTSALTALLDL